MATRVSPCNTSRCRDERKKDPQQEQAPVRSPRVIKHPHRGGYDCEFVQKPPSNLVQADCPVCLLVLREPHQVTCCGYSYCQSCIERIQNTNNVCPACNKEFETYPDKRLKRSLYALKVYCSHREAACDWVGDLLELDGHLNLQPPPEKLLMGCQFSEVDCTYCVQPFQRRYVQAHLSDDCPKRPYACPHCNEYAATFEATYEEVTQNHWPVCPFFPLSCPHNCELVLQRQELEHHVSRDCPLTVVKCDFHMVGCQIELTRSDMPSHINENLSGHMSLLQVHMMTHPGENMAAYLCLMVGSVQKVVQDNANVHSELHKAQKTLRETCAELQKTQETVAQLEALSISQQEQHNICREENKTLYQQKDDLTERLIASEQKIQALDSQLAAINSENKQLHHKLEGCTAELEQRQQNTTLAHGELQEKIQQTSSQLQTTVTAHKKEKRETTAALIQHKRESDEKLRATQEKLSNELTGSERKIQTQIDELRQTCTQLKTTVTAQHTIYQHKRERAMKN